MMRTLTLLLPLLMVGQEALASGKHLPPVRGEDEPRYFTHYKQPSAADTSRKSMAHSKLHTTTDVAPEPYLKTSLGQVPETESRVCKTYLTASKSVVPGLTSVTVTSTSTVAVPTTASLPGITTTMSTEDTSHVNLPTSTPIEPPASTTQVAFKPIFSVDGCYETPGGLQENGTIGSGCGAMLDHIQICHDSYIPGDDLENADQNSIFQACVCGTSKSSPFTNRNPLYKNFTGCAHCLLSTHIPTFSYVSTELRDIINFCRSQNPFPWTFYSRLSGWLSNMQDQSNRGATEIGPLTGALNEAVHYTTKPPLANLAYGASAPTDGSLARVSPSLTTFTTMRKNPIGCCNLPATVTALVAWVPTQVDRPYNSKAAAHSEVKAASSSLETALCDGRGPGQCGYGGVVSRRPPLYLLLFAYGVAVALLDV